MLRLLLFTPIIVRLPSPGGCRVSSEVGRGWGERVKVNYTNSKLRLRVL